MCPSCKKNTLINLGETKICGSCWMLCRVDGTPILSTTVTPEDARPPFPRDAAVKDMVFDYTVDENGIAIYTSRTYCPREAVMETPFDPNDPHFKFAMKVHRKKFKNRRRYMYERQRKMSDAVSQ